MSHGELIDRGICQPGSEGYAEPTGIMAAGGIGTGMLLQSSSSSAVSPCTPSSVSPSMSLPLSAPTASVPVKVHTGAALSGESGQSRCSWRDDGES